jgi:uncharacterized membrane protein YhaH (DUF805 family)
MRALEPNVKNASHDGIFMLLRGVSLSLQPNRQMDNPYQAPEANLISPFRSAPKTWKEILFTFEGRIPRRTYWAATLLFTGISMAITIPILIFGNLSTSRENPVSAFLSNGAFLAFIPLWALFFYCGLAVSIKRWHDRNKSGWWCLIGFIPYIGSLWVLIENGCLRGTIGPNNYGEDPT